MHRSDLQEEARMTSIRELRVVVAGGGIVGLTAGLALRRAGAHVVVCEQAPQIRAAGASLGVWRNAMAVFEDLGIGADVEALGKPSEMLFHDPAGRVIEPSGFSPDDHRYLLVDRMKLTNLLADAVGRSRIRLDSRVVGYQERADDVVVRFADGGTERADLLIGADGAYSVVREHLVAGAAPQQHAGHFALRALLPSSPVRVADDVMVLGSSGCRGGYARTYDGGVFWLVSRFNAPAMAGTKQEQALTIAGHLNEGDWNPVLTEVIAATPDDDILHNPIMIVPPLPTWTSARVALVGDAAHAMSPHITAGASLGVEDAALLVRCLTSCDGLSLALATYESDRMPHYRHVDRLSKAVELASTPQEFARHYVAFSHWMINQHERTDEAPR